MEWFLILGVAVLSTLTQGAERCCDDIGCFSNDFPFSHLPVPECPQTFSPRFGMYTRANKDTPQYLTRTSIPSVFEAGRRTIFLSHGYMGNYYTSTNHEFKTALLEREDANVVIVGWGGGADNLYYPQSASNTRAVGAEIALLVQNLRDVTDGELNVWCVGFSLGAHLCGHAGMRSNLTRITALDPAGPYFANYNIMAGVNPTAARLVDVIHTDGAGILAWYGTLKPLGHMDFYPNGGKYQPGCWTYLADPATQKPVKREVSTKSVKQYGSQEEFANSPEFRLSLACSHGRANDLFLQSIRDTDDCFVAKQICADQNNLPKYCVSCRNDVCGHMGYAADEATIKGKMYLETTSRKPYCKI